MTHPSVNDRLREEVEFLRAQNTQFRLIMGVLVHRLGGTAAVAQADFTAMQVGKLAFAMSQRAASVDEAGAAVPEALVLETLHEDVFRERAKNAPRIVAPSDKLTLVQPAK